MSVRLMLTLFVLMNCVSMQAFSAEVLTARTLKVGSIVQEADLTLADESSAQAAMHIIGKEVKRAVYVGRAISATDVGPVTIISRNEIVRLFYQSEGLGIRTEARALEPGGLGDQISFMNLATRVTVRAEVTGVKRARVAR